MPAIDLPRLKMQAARLAEKFSDPAAFIADLQALLESYQDRSRRAAQVVARTSLPSFRTPRPVLHQILIALTPQAIAHPWEATALVDALWQAGYLETRFLAAVLIGRVPPEDAMPLYGRLGEWLEESREKEIQQALLQDAFSRLRREQPEAMLALVGEWLSAASSKSQVWGLQALTALLQEPDFEDLPRAFRLLRPALRAAGPATQMALMDCLQVLCRLSPTETLYFLREVLMDRPPPMMVRTLQRILSALPAAVQDRLRAELRLLNKT